MMGPPPPAVEETTTPTLTGIDFRCKSGSLTCVVGKIGTQQRQHFSYRATQTKLTEAVRFF